MVIKRCVKLENGELVKLEKLKKDDWKNKDADFWKTYRESLYKIIKWEEQQKKEKTPKMIVDMAKKIGIKPTARYFNIQPSQVRYWIKKLQ